MPTPQELYREIPLTQGQITLVDVSDYEWLMRWKWYARWNPRAKTFYVCRQDPRGVGGKRSNIWMHREILGLESDNILQGDHVNHSGLDNRRHNLRVVTAGQNLTNRRTFKNSTTTHAGITREMYKGRVRCWTVQVQYQGKRVRKRFKNMDDAIKSVTELRNSEQGVYRCP